MIVAVDTEASGLHPDPGKKGDARCSVLSYAYRARNGRVVARALPFGQGPEHEHDAGFDKWRGTMDWLAEQQLVFHNAKYDLHILRAGTIHGYMGYDLTEQFRWDTMLGQWVIDPLEERSLKKSSRRLLGADEWEGDLDAALQKTKPKKRFDLVPWEIMEPYATADPRWTLLLYELQLERLDAGEGSLSRCQREMKVCRTLARMEFRGISFDAPGCQRDAVKIKREMDRLEKVLPFVPTPQRAAKYYFDDLGIPPVSLTPTGKYQMNEAVRAKLKSNRKARHIAEYDRWCDLETALTTWYAAYPSMTGHDGRLRTTYRQAGTVSGRFSASRVNLQAIPHDGKIPAGVQPIRSYIRPKLGSKLWEVDVSQAEVRVAAAICRCEPMLETIRAGQDVHWMVAGMMFGVDDTHPEGKVYRQFGKKCVYLMLYAGGAKVLQHQVKEDPFFIERGITISLNQAYDYVSRFRDAFPEFMRETYRAQHQAEQARWVRTALGVRSWFMPYEMAQSYKALNRRIQGGVGEVMKLSMVRVEDKHPGVQLLQIHDSLVLETLRPKVVESCASIVREAFEDEYRIPFVVDIKEWK